MKTWNLDDYKINDIVLSLQDHKWIETLGELNANNGFDIFHSLLIETIDKIAPETEIKLSKGKTARDLWITKGILNSIWKQKKLYLDQLHNTNITTKYKAYRNQLQKIIRKAKTSYFREKCKEYKQNSRKLWKLIQEILNKAPNKGESIKAINIEGVPRYDPATITNEFCKHFSSIGEMFANKIPPSTKEISEYLNNIPQNEKCIFLNPTDSTEIKELINDLVPKNSSGYNNLLNKLLKRLLPAVIEPLTIIFNKSLTEGVFLKPWKRQM